MNFSKRLIPGKNPDLTILFFFLAGIIPLTFSLLNLAGWITNNQWMISLGKDLPSMAATTAILFFFIIAPYFLLLVRFNWSNTRLAILTITSVVVLVNLTLLTLAFTGFQTALPSLEFGPGQPTGTVPVGHMSPITSLLFILSASTLFILGRYPGRTKPLLVSFSLSLLILFISGAILISYLVYPSLQTEVGLFPMALNTTLSFFFIGIGMVLFIRTPTMKNRHANDSAVMVSLFLPVTVSMATTIMLIFVYLNILTIFKNLNLETQTRLTLITQMKVQELEKEDFMDTDPDQLILKLNWPVASQSGKITLAGYHRDTLFQYTFIQSDLDSSFSLKKNPALFPGSALEQGLAGQTGMLTTKESDSNKLISCILTIRDSGWIIMSSIDESMANKPLIRQLIQITMLIIGLLALAISMLVLMSRQLRIRSYQEQIEATRILQEQLIRSNNEAQQSNRLKDAFIANISHEIRTPLNAIVGFTQLIRDHLAESTIPEYDNYFEVIQKSSDRLTRTIEMILNVSRLQVGIYNLKPVEINLDQKIQELVCEYSPAALKKGIRMHYTNTTAKAVITADEYCVVHPISNLIDNAVKYTHQGDVTLKLYRDAEDRISLDVADTGIGISEEFISEIFRPFTQEDNSSTRRYEGMGLALAITQRLLAAIHATISVKSNKGKGTTFTITF